MSMLSSVYHALYQDKYCTWMNMLIKVYRALYRDEHCTRWTWPKQNISDYLHEDTILFLLTLPTSLSLSLSLSYLLKQALLIIDSDGTLVGVFATFSPLHYVGLQEQYYKYFIALSTQWRHSEDDNVKLYCVKTVEDTRPIKAY